MRAFMLSKEAFLPSMPLQGHFMWLANKTLRAFSVVKFGKNGQHHFGHLLFWKTPKCNQNRQPQTALRRDICVSKLEMFYVDAQHERPLPLQSIRMGVGWLPGHLRPHWLPRSS